MHVRNKKPKLNNSNFSDIYYYQSYVIKSAPWTILWFRILGIFSVENIKRLCVFMFQTCSNSQLLRRVLWISAEQTIGASLKHKNTQPLYIFNRVRVLHLNRLKERTWLHSFVWREHSNLSITRHSGWDWFIMHVKLGHSMDNGFIFKKINKN